jgi:hypothetical protein
MPLILTVPHFSKQSHPHPVTGKDTGRTRSHKTNGARNRRAMQTFQGNLVPRSAPRSSILLSAAASSSSPAYGSPWSFYPIVESQKYFTTTRDTFVNCPLYKYMRTTSYACKFCVYTCDKTGGHYLLAPSSTLGHENTVTTSHPWSELIVCAYNRPTSESPTIRMPVYLL